jgi:hypothetical protein
VDPRQSALEETDIESGIQFKGGWTHCAGRNTQAGQTKHFLARNGEFH